MDKYTPYIHGRHTANGKDYTWSLTWEQYDILETLAQGTTCDDDEIIIASVVSALPDGAGNRVIWVEVTGFGQKVADTQGFRPMLDTPVITTKEEIRQYMPDYFGDGGEESYEE